MIEWFNRNYVIAKSEFEDLMWRQIPQFGQPDAQEEPTYDQKAREAAGAIQQLFALEVLGFFAEYPGWVVESDGKHLALHRGTEVGAADRQQFLADALTTKRWRSARSVRTESEPFPWSSPTCCSRAHALPGR